jgi:polysaccharide deacetylase 2 family uncharacterized protein YibQ
MANQIKNQDLNNRLMNLVKKAQMLVIFNNIEGARDSKVLRLLTLLEQELEK